MNPYEPPISSSRHRDQRSLVSNRKFRWQVIPATLTFFAALLPLALAVLCVLGWIEYRQSDRYDPSRSMYWMMMQFSLVPISLFTVVLLCLSGWAWIRRTPSKAIALLMAGRLLLGSGLLMRV